MPEPVLRPASENPWYVLATVAGECDPDDPMARATLEKNRRLWNAWMARDWDDARVLQVADRLGVEPAKLRPPSSDEVEQIFDAFAARLPEGLPPDPRNGLADFSHTVFDRHVFLSGFVFPDRLDAKGCRFESGLTANKADFWHGATFANSAFGADALLSLCDFGPGLVLDGARFVGRLELDCIRALELSLEGVQIARGFGLSQAEIEGGIKARGCRIGGSFRSEHLVTILPLFEFDLTEAQFEGGVDFSHARLETPVNLRGASFSHTAVFFDVHFGAEANFDGVSFAQTAMFRGTRFCGSAVFVAAGFRADADFSATTFDSPADFTAANFAAKADFSDGAFHGPTRFQRARFQTQPPRFFGRSLHADTGFSLVQRDWPRITAAAAAEAKSAFTRLRHAVQDLQMADEEHFFFRQEMRCKQVLDGWPDRWLIRAYGLLSDYGNSVTRPLVALGVVVVLGWIAVHLGIGVGWAEALGISILSALPFLGLLPVIQPGFHDAAPAWLDALSVGQGVAGFALLFFLGLGLRNRFRLK